MRGSMCPSVCSFAIETTFPLSNFKTKHIFGTLMAMRKVEDRRRPKFFVFIIFLPPPMAALPEAKGNAAWGGCFASIS